MSRLVYAAPVDAPSHGAKPLRQPHPIQKHPESHATLTSQLLCADNFSVEDSHVLKRLSKARWRRALILTAVMLLIYFGFIILTALYKPVMGTLLTDGLSLGILLGAMVIIAAFVLTGLYVRWANAHYDPELRAMRARHKAEASAAPRAL